MKVKEGLKKASNKKNNAVQEKLVSSFSAFQSRFRKVMCDPSKRSIPLDLSNEQLEALYNGITPVIETSIFAEMEHVMTAIRTSFDTVIDRECENIQLKPYMSNEKNFKRFITHVVTNYQSLQEKRINILMVHNKAYQMLEDNLFGETFIFQKAYQLHNELIQAFHNFYHDLLFEGKILNTDKKVEERVIEPIVQSYEVKIGEMLEGGENG